MSITLARRSFYKTTVDVLCLAIDLAYRTLHILGTESMLEMVAIHSITCFWMAYKYLKGKHAISNIQSLSGYSIPSIGF